MNKILSTLLLSFLFVFSAAAFECKEVIGHSYYSAGDSDFQYHYQFKKEGKLKLTTYMSEHNEKENTHTISQESFTGTYLTQNDKLIIKITVDDVKHKITFSCRDNIQYMNVGPKSKSLQVVQTLPKNHSFSLIHLWPKGSPVIRQYLNNVK